jgi:hypothetical protein
MSNEATTMNYYRLFSHTHSRQSISILNVLCNIGAILNMHYHFPCTIRRRGRANSGIHTLRVDIGYT